MTLFKRSLTSGSSQGSSDHPVPDSQHPTTSEPPLQPPTMPSSIPAPPFGRTLISAQTRTQIEEDGAQKRKLNGEMVESEKRKLRSRMTLSIDESVNSPTQFHVSKTGYTSSQSEETESLVLQNEELRKQNAALMAIMEKQMAIMEDQEKQNAILKDQNAAKLKAMEKKLDWLISTTGCQSPKRPCPRDDNPNGGSASTPNL